MSLVIVGYQIRFLPLCVLEYTWCYYIIVMLMHSCGYNLLTVTVHVACDLHTPRVLHNSTSFNLQLKRELQHILGEQSQTRESDHDLGALSKEQ